MGAANDFKIRAQLRKNRSEASQNGFTVNIHARQFVVTELAAEWMLYYLEANF